jgi:hypothetical protein
LKESICKEGILLLKLHTLDSVDPPKESNYFEVDHTFVCCAAISSLKMLAKLKEIDFYRRIPKDLTETSLHGSVLSICAAIFMLVLFVAELWAFLSTTTITSVIVDPNTETQLRINFNITLMDMPCEFATIDVVDVLGTRYENVSKNVNKWKIDENGLRRSYQGRNVEQRDLDHDVGHDLDQLLENGVHAVPLDTDGNYISS